MTVMVTDGGVVSMDKHYGCGDDEKGDDADKNRNGEGEDNADDSDDDHHCDNDDCCGKFEC